MLDTCIASKSKLVPANSVDCSDFKGQVFQRSLAIVQQDRVLSHFQFAERFYVDTSYREQFHKSLWRRPEKHFSS